MYKRQIRHWPDLLNGGAIGWEAYGFQAGDIEALKEELNKLELNIQESDPGFILNVKLVPIKQDNNPGAKDDRIQSMTYRASRGAYWLPPPGQVVFTGWDGEEVDLRSHIDESLKWFPDNKPRGGQKDILDSLQMESVINRTPFLDTGFTRSQDPYESDEQELEADNPFSRRIGVNYEHAR